MTTIRCTICGEVTCQREALLRAVRRRPSGRVVMDEAWDAYNHAYETCYAKRR